MYHEKIIIKAVEKLSVRQGFKTLNVFNRNKKEIIFTDYDMLTGVDWNKKENETDNIQEDENK